MKKILLILPVCAALTLTGCSNMSKTEQTTLSGGAIGAGATGSEGEADGCEADGPRKQAIQSM